MIEQVLPRLLDVEVSDAVIRRGNVGSARSVIQLPAGFPQRGCRAEQRWMRPCGAAETNPTARTTGPADGRNQRTPAQPEGERQRRQEHARMDVARICGPASRTCDQRTVSSSTGWPGSRRDANGNAARRRMRAALRGSADTTSTTRPGSGTRARTGPAPAPGEDTGDVHAPAQLRGDERRQRGVHFLVARTPRPG